MTGFFLLDNIMAKELPYFRFTVSEWLNDDISLESYHLQGVFASVCAFYWFQDCSIALAKLKKRFSDASDDIDLLVKLRIIKVTQDGFAQIKFLDKQYDALSEKRQKRVRAGRKGGLSRASNAKAMLKQSLSYKDKDKDKDKDKESIYAFDDFWDDYDKKKDRKKSKSKWNNISEKDREKIKEFIPVYKAHQPEEKFRKLPTTFLNSEIWNDDWSAYPPKQEQNHTSNGNHKTRTKGDDHVAFLTRNER
jgi:hypothetical protein